MASSVQAVDSISYESFLTNITSPNPSPLLIGPSLTRSWAAASGWARPDGAPNLTALRRYAHHAVQVADCMRRAYNEFERTERPLREVLDLWERGEGEGLYVKDWHCVFEVEEGGGSMDEVYETPEIFKDDWLTPFLLRSPPPGQPASDYRFTYAGPRGTFTPFHRDVFGSYSWSANVVGRKRWWLVRPENVHAFVDADGAARVFDLRQLEREGDARWSMIEVEDQPPGHTIFVPSGWWHQVENLDFCISINQNFIASATLPAMWANLLGALERCAASIADVREMIQQRLGDLTQRPGEEDSGRTQQGEPAQPVYLWEIEWIDEVQKLLEMDFGMSVAGFWRMVLWNIKNPPAAANLRPSDAFVARTITPIIDEYKRRREWVILEPVQAIICEIERVLAGVVEQ